MVRQAAVEVVEEGGAGKTYKFIKSIKFIKLIKSAKIYLSSRSSTDRIKVCGTFDGSSILPENTRRNIKNQI